MDSRKYKHILFEIFLQNYNKEFTVDKLFQYKIYDLQRNEEPLQLMAESVVFYSKVFRAELDARPTSFNFAMHGADSYIQNVYLVLESGSFNISKKKVGLNSSIYVFCSRNVVTHRFILFFSNENTSQRIYRRVANHLDNQIFCTTDWLRPEILQKINPA